MRPEQVAQVYEKERPRILRELAAATGADLPDIEDAMQLAVEWMLTHRSTRKEMTGTEWAEFLWTVAWNRLRELQRSDRMRRRRETRWSRSYYD